MISTTISPEFEQFVRREVASGKYGSTEEVVSEGLRLLRQQELDALRREIDVGLADVEHGEVIEIDDDQSSTAFFEDVKLRGRERLAEQPPQ
jgi:antitoxin ParD1/3/4